jgi:hypothetical protein
MFLLYIEANSVSNTKGTVSSTPTLYTSKDRITAQSFSFASHFMFVACFLSVLLHLPNLVYKPDN